MTGTGEGRRNEDQFLYSCCLTRRDEDLSKTLKPSRPVASRRAHRWQLVFLVKRGLRDPCTLAAAIRTTVWRRLRDLRQPQAAASNKEMGAPASHPAARDSLKRISERSSALSNQLLAKRLQERRHPFVSASTIGRALRALDMVRKMPAAKKTKY